MGTIDLIRRARAQGFEFRREKSRVIISRASRPDDPAMLDEIRANKDSILAGIAPTVDGVLERGMQWLTKCSSLVLDDPDNDELVDRFIYNLDRWAEKDEHLRKTFPAFTGCSVGGCDDKAPVRCLYCAQLTPQ